MIGEFDREVVDTPVIQGNKVLPKFDLENDASSSTGEKEADGNDEGSEGR